MCWISDKLPVRRVARKDTYVYKIVVGGNTGCTSAVRNLYYEYNKIYTQEKPINVMLLKLSKQWMIEKGFHSYKTYSKAKEEYYKLDFPYYTIVQCIIPKGSTFYENENGEIVSDSIVISNSFRNYVVYEEWLSILIIGILFGVMLSVILNILLT